MTSGRIPFIDPHFPSGAELAADIDGIRARNWYTNNGPLAIELSRRVGAFVGEGVSASLVSNATTGLMLALHALVEPSQGFRKNVLLPSFTFAAGAQAVMWNGLAPVLLDVEPDTWQPDLAQASAYLDEAADSVAAILFCNTFGVGATSIGAWEALAARHGVPLVVDSAAGFGSEYAGGERLGGRGDCEVFSFHATKPFAVGEGGAVTTRDDALLERVDRLRNFGFDAARQAQLLGFNAKLPELTCAVGLRQLEGFEARLDARRERQATYLRLLGDAVGTQPGIDRSSVAFVSVVLPVGVDRDGVIAALGADGVEARSYYKPALHHQDLFAKCELAGRPDLPVTDRLCESILSLPMSDRMTDADIDRVVGLVRPHLA